MSVFDIPEGLDPDEVYRIINKIATRLSYKYRFSYHDADDLKQEAIIEGYKGLANYKGGHPLENFLSIHIKNRIYNYKRDRYIRLEKPCTRCVLKAFLPPEGCSAFKDRMECKAYARWTNNNMAKRNLANTLFYDQVLDQEKEKNMKYTASLIEDINDKEMLSLFNDNIHISIRKYYLMMISGHKVIKKCRTAIYEACHTILLENKYDGV